MSYTFLKTFFCCRLVDRYWVFSSEQTKSFFSTSVCLNPHVPGHLFMVGQSRSLEEGLGQPVWMRVCCESHSLIDQRMLILVAVKEATVG